MFGRGDFVCEVGQDVAVALQTFAFFLHEKDLSDGAKYGKVNVLQRARGLLCNVTH